MVKDKLIERTDYGGNPPHIEYELTERGRVLLPLVDALRVVGQTLDCNQCEDRRNQLAFYCEACPKNVQTPEPEAFREEPASLPRRRQRDDSIVLL
jgi:hypothetical protein